MNFKARSNVAGIVFLTVVVWLFIGLAIALGEQPVLFCGAMTPRACKTIIHAEHCICHEQN